MDYADAMRSAQIPLRAQNTTLEKVGRIDLRNMLLSGELVDEEGYHIGATFYVADPADAGRGRLIAQVFAKENILRGNILTHVVTLSRLQDTYKHEGYSALSAVFSMFDHIVIIDFFRRGTENPLGAEDAHAIHNCILDAIDEGKAIYVFGDCEPRTWTAWWPTSLLRQLERFTNSIQLG